MNMMKKAFAILTLVSVVTLAGRTYNTPVDAATSGNAVSNYLRQGFTIDSVTPQQNFYIVAPTGNFAWGSVVVELHGKTGGAYSLETTYATVVAYVDGVTRQGSVKYEVNYEDVTEQIVY